jgi:hypothetical protein
MRLPRKGNLILVLGSQKNQRIGLRLITLAIYDKFKALTAKSENSDSFLNGERSKITQGSSILHNRFLKKYAKILLTQNLAKMKKLQSIILIFLMSPLFQSVFAQVRAIKSDDFVERIGVCTHFDYYDTPYGTKFTKVKTKLGELGVRYYRNGPDADYPLFATRVKDLYDTYGLKMQAVFPANFIATGHGYDSGKVAQTLDLIRDNIGTKYFLNMEGLNEPDNWNDNSPNYGAMTREVQKAIYTKMKKDAAWANVPVLGPSIALGGGYAAIGDMKSMTDKGNIHWYPSGIQPSHQEFNLFDWHLDQCKTKNYSDNRAIVMTETGYSNSGGTQACPEDIAAKYTPRQFMYFLYTQGMERVFSYEFLNEWDRPADAEGNFGLLRNDLTEKPAYTSLKNIISMLKEPSANFTPGELTYNLFGDMKDIKQVLFQKSNGTFYLVVWQEVKSYDQIKKSPIDVPERELTLSLTNSILTANVYRPAPLPIGNGLTVTKSYSRPPTIELSVPDQLLVIELIPSTSPLVAVTNVALTSATGTVNVGEKLPVRATISPSDATLQNVTWSSSDNAIATVTPGGTVKGISVGNATISAKTIDGGFTSSIEIKVQKSVITGVDKKKEDVDFKVFPNPVYDAKVRIQGVNRMAQLRVMDLSGKVLLLKDMDITDLEEIDLSLPSGTYLIVIDDATKTQKIIVK